MNQEQMFSLLRAILNSAGGGLVTGGIVAQGDWTSICTGVAMILAPVAWSLYEKTKARMIAKVDAMPEVKGVVTKDTVAGRALAQDVPSTTVVPAGTVAAATIAKT